MMFYVSSFLYKRSSDIITTLIGSVFACGFSSVCVATFPEGNHPKLELLFLKDLVFCLPSFHFKLL